MSDKTFFERQLETLKTFTIKAEALEPDGSATKAANRLNARGHRRHDGQPFTPQCLRTFKHTYLRPLPRKHREAIARAYEIMKEAAE